MTGIHSSLRTGTVLLDVPLMGKPCRSSNEEHGVELRSGPDRWLAFARRGRSPWRSPHRKGDQPLREQRVEPSRDDMQCP
jgi:hypothetical protein